MFDPTRPHEVGPDSLAPAEIGQRLACANSRGLEPARLLWFFILSHMPYDGAARPTWASNETLARESGLTVYDVEFALQRLREAGLLLTPQARERPGARRRWGRVLVPMIDAPVKVLVPSREQMARLWSRCRTIRERPGTLVTAAVGCYVLAASVLDRPLDQVVSVRMTGADLRRLVGGKRGAAWTARVRDLERAGLVTRRPKAWMVWPPSRW